MAEQVITPEMAAVIDSMGELTWQPIKTAPKDGRMIVLAGSSEYCLPHKVEVAVGYWREGKWLTFGAANGFSVCYPPTHWMPVPKFD